MIIRMGVELLYNMAPIRPCFGIDGIALVQLNLKGWGHFVLCPRRYILVAINREWASQVHTSD